MKKLNNTEAELKKALLIKKACNCWEHRSASTGKLYYLRFSGYLVSVGD